MPTFHYLVSIEADSEALAEQVMAERINPDEDYGFDYSIGWGRWS